MATETTHHVAMTLSDHLPVLAILVPFVAAPLCVLLGSRSLTWPITFLASAASFVTSFLLLLSVIDGGFISYHIGGWAPPLGIEYRVDAANAFVLFLVTGISTIVLPYARESVKSEIPERHHTLFYACFLLCLTGLLGVAVTGDAFNVFVFLEISSLSTYVLIAQGSYRDRRALTAAYDYLIMGTIGATFFVIGLGMLYMATGTLNMADLADRIADQGANRTVRAAFAFIVVGIGLKVAIYPLHLWLPNAYTYAPSAVTAFLAATATKVAVYVLMRFLFSVFQPSFLFEVNTLEFMIIPFAILAMFAASFIAIFQTDLKRLLAYSSIAQIGYMLLGIGLLNESGVAAAVAHLFNHGITKAVLFMGVGALVLRSGGSFFDRIEGMGKLMPWTSAAIVIGGLSLIGVPGTAGFLSKWLLVQGALEKGWWPIAILVVLSSLLAVIYVWRIVEAMYLRSPASDIEAKEAPLSMLVPIWIMAIACIYFGFATDITLTASHTAAQGLLAGPVGLH
ncbi:monovalent cation/H+ antiporter subunit D family protein [Pseudohalocynthiibacter aestuariivivens]|jgi:multicomponent Na+:H+ antiporter subunit D|uniref:Monovalent cation/H+ antiporter subunit D family protein n=1 Tax=Pseudohalocynthiibacter aestuariivivens TaxID=1591409 RepID=A0ABV5JH52_9RHOB|nr:MULTISPECIES: monovalent cation/H+ antiporter subunit D family protein [Pseudohalocynthiibacter]MBS9718480.1 monovalent cation/H+ antiporter subunit D family protein [Pseudohalocynthiibacter aestuariivivens]MCK0104051.1 monovalent cation/H+ antiporter subunit D family protein [Pseudohalocynthiibacter sp. F2068]